MNKHPQKCFPFIILVVWLFSPVVCRAENEAAALQALQTYLDSVSRKESDNLTVKVNVSNGILGGKFDIQFRDPQISVIGLDITEADRLNGLSYKAYCHIRVSVYRVKDSTGWSKWRDGGVFLKGFAVLENDAWKIKLNKTELDVQVMGLPAVTMKPVSHGSVKAAAKKERDVPEQPEKDLSTVLKQYAPLIRAKVGRHWHVPTNVRRDVAAEVTIELDESGAVVSVKTVRSSGFEVFDRSIENAIFKASPLPIPRDSAYNKEFRKLRLRFRPDA